MKTIGLIGGMSWESTVVYYQLLNKLTREKLGKRHSAKLLLWSFDFAEIENLQAKGDWEMATREMIKAARNLEKGGADCIVICTNTMHKMADDIQQAVDLPLIHIADATATAIRASDCTHPLLLATRYTMQQDFYRGRLQIRHGITCRIPETADQTTVHNIIYNELCQGVILTESKQQYLDVITRATSKGADGVIFGCTEIGLLLSQTDLDIPGFDSTELHVKAALEFAIH